MIPSYAGVVTSQDLAQGEINHALCLLVPPALLRIAFQEPASGYDSNTTAYAGTLAMGERLGLPRNLEISSLGVTSPLGMMLARAAQHHGLFVTDSGGGGATIVMETATRSHDLVRWSPGLQHDLELIAAALVLVKTSGN
jgi:hypothetical protein